MNEAQTRQVVFSFNYLMRDVINFNKNSFIFLPYRGVDSIDYEAIERDNDQEIFSNICFQAVGSFDSRTAFGSQDIYTNLQFKKSHLLDMKMLFSYETKDKIKFYSASYFKKEDRAKIVYVGATKHIANLAKEIIANSAVPNAYAPRLTNQFSPNNLFLFSIPFNNKLLQEQFTESNADKFISDVAPKLAF